MSATSTEAKYCAGRDLSPDAGSGELGESDRSHPPASEDLHVEIHAVLKYLSRVDAEEPFPRTRLRELYQEAYGPVPHGPAGTRWHPETGLVLITEAGTLTTCYCRTARGVGLTDADVDVNEETTARHDQ